MKATGCHDGWSGSRGDTSHTGRGSADVGASQSGPEGGREGILHSPLPTGRLGGEEGGQVRAMFSFSPGRETFLNCSRGATIM